MLDLESATSDSVTVNGTLLSYDGGSPVSKFVYRRDDGPETAWQSQVEQTATLDVPRFQFTGLSSAKRVYRFQMAAVNELGQGPWSDAVSFLATSPPLDPEGFQVTQQSTTSISLSWSAPAGATSPDDCPVEGYRVLMEDTHEPGLKIVYDGPKSSTTTSYTLRYPTIRASRYYKLLLQSKNCGEVLSPGRSLTVASASVPSQIERAPHVVSYDAPTLMTVGWANPPSGGGFEVLNYKIWLDNNVVATLEASKNTYEIKTSEHATLTLGKALKVQISSVNEVGESALSPSARLTFAYRPSDPASLTLTSTSQP